MEYTSDGVRLKTSTGILTRATVKIIKLFSSYSSVLFIMFIMLLISSSTQTDLNNVHFFPIISIDITNSHNTAIVGQDEEALYAVAKKKKLAAFSFFLHPIKYTLLYFVRYNLPFSFSYFYYFVSSPSCSCCVLLCTCCILVSELSSNVSTSHYDDPGVS